MWEIVKGVVTDESADNDNLDVDMLDVWAPVTSQISESVITGNR